MPMRQDRPRLANDHGARHAWTGKCPWEKTGVDRTGLVNVWVAIKERDLFC